MVAPDIFDGDAVGNHCLGVARAAARCGHEVLVFANASNVDSVRPIAALWDTLRDDDVLYLSYSIHDPHLERLAGHPGRKVCFFHGVTEPSLLQESDPVTAELCRRSIEQFATLNRFDVIVANSRWTATSLAGAVDPARIRALPPISPDMPIFRMEPFDAAPPAAEAELLMLGRVVPHKAIDDGIRALGSLRAMGRSARLTVVGTWGHEAYLGELRALAAEQGLEADVVFTGALGMDDLLACFRRSHMLLSFSRHEGFCVPVLEAMWLGRPAMVRAGTAAVEVGGDAVAAFATPEQASAMVAELLDDTSLQARMIHAGHARARQLLHEVRDDVVCRLLAGDE